MSVPSIIQKLKGYKDKVLFDIAEALKDLHERQKVSESQIITIINNPGGGTTDPPPPSGTAGLWRDEKMVGAVDGSNTQFSLTATPKPKESLQVSINGAIYSNQAKGGADWTLNVNKVTMAWAPPTGEQPWAHYVYEEEAVPFPDGGVSFPPSIAREYTGAGLVGSAANDGVQSWVQFQSNAKWSAAGDWSFFAWFKFRSAGSVALIAQGYPDITSSNQQYVVDFNVAGSGSVRYAHDVGSNLSYMTFSPLGMSPETAYFVCLVREAATKSVKLYSGDKTIAPTLRETKTYTTDPPSGSYGAQVIRIGKPPAAGAGTFPITDGDIGPVGMAVDRAWTPDEVLLAYQGNPVLTDLQLWGVPGQDPDDATFINLVSPSDTVTVNLAPLITDF